MSSEDSEYSGNISRISDPRFASFASRVIGTLGAPLDLQPSSPVQYGSDEPDSEERRTAEYYVHDPLMSGLGVTSIEPGTSSRAVVGSTLSFATFHA